MMQLVLAARLHTHLHARNPLTLSHTQDKYLAIKIFPASSPGPEPLAVSAPSFFSELPSASLPTPGRARHAALCPLRILARPRPGHALSGSPWRLRGREHLQA